MKNKWIDRLNKKVIDIKAVYPHATFERLELSPTAYREIQEELAALTAFEVKFETYQGVPVKVIKVEDDYYTPDRGTAKYILSVTI